NNQKNRTALLTGSTGGIGLEVAKLLAGSGWHLALVNRSKDKAQKQLAELQEAHPDQRFTAYAADMMDLAEIRRVTEEVAAQHAELSAIYHIAGLLTDKRMTSPQGFEGHFAVNTLAPYLITQRLRKQLSAGSTSEQKSVVVYFSTGAIKGVKALDVQLLANPAEIGGLMGAYAKTKLAITMVMPAQEQAFAEEGILIESVDPGPTKTPMTSNGDGMPWFISLLQPILFKSAEVQAQKLVSAVDDAVAANRTGLFISEGKIKPVPQIVSDKEIQAALITLLDSQVADYR
ncbi:MAG: SDR family NAD(P)-dependent oxidoreductase, partial [Verrucomicrobiota bacterium]